MKLTKLDVLARAPDFDERTAPLALSRWKWDLLELVDGTRSLDALAAALHVDGEVVTAFSEECVAIHLLRPVTVTRAEHAGRAGAPAPALVPEPPRADDAPPPRSATLQERVAALKARALSAIGEAAEKPRLEPRAEQREGVEFALSSSPKGEPPPSDDAIEFSL
jgi:hypothetical protein